MIDRIDAEILCLLGSDGRMPYLELARRAHLSPNAIAERVRKLTKTGIIKGIYADVDQAALGKPLPVYVDFRVRPGEDFLRFEQALRRTEGAVEISVLSGHYDFQVKLYSSDQDDLRKKVATLRLQPGVEESNTRMILRESKLPSPKAVSDR